MCAEISEGNRPSLLFRTGMRIMKFKSRDLGDQGLSAWISASIGLRKPQETKNQTFGGTK